MTDDKTGQNANIGSLMQNVARQQYPGATLYVLATPIGNIGDISLRALHVLSLVDAIVCEDTRLTGSLLSQYGISKELMVAHQHNERRSVERIIARISKGERIALVTDAGTPAIADPGVRLVDAVLLAGLNVVPVPGASAATAALSAGGLFADHFYFAGFLPPRATAREAMLKSLKSMSATLVFYEVPHRIAETLAALGAVFEGDRKIVIAREMTKLFGQIHRCTLSEATAWVNASPHHARGEFVLVVEGAKGKGEGEEDDAFRVLSILLSELPVSQAAALTSRISGIGKNRLYEAALKMKDEKI